MWCTYVWSINDKFKQNKFSKLNKFRVHYIFQFVWHVHSLKLKLVRWDGDNGDVVAVLTFCFFFSLYFFSGGGGGSRWILSQTANCMFLDCSFFFSFFCKTVFDKHCLLMWCDPIRSDMMSARWYVNNEHPPILLRIYTLSCIDKWKQMWANILISPHLQLSIVEKFCTWVCVCVKMICARFSWNCK